MKTKKYLFVSIAILVAAFLSACAGAAPDLTVTNGEPGTTVIAQPQVDAGNQSQPLGIVPNQGAPQQGGPDLTSAAETLGVTVEELQQALQDAIPEECASTDGQPVQGTDCRPDLTVAAEALGVTAEELQAALGKAGTGNRERDLTAAAEALGVTVEELQQALQDARPAECTATDGQPAQGVDCRADLEAAALALSVTTEELQTALGFNDRGPDFAAVAEALGVTEDELQQALQDATPEGCVEGQQPAEGVDCRPDLESIATALGVTTEELQTALQESFQGGRGPNGGHPQGGPNDGNGQPPQGGPGGNGQPPQGGPGGQNGGQNGGQPPAPTQP